MKRPGKAIKVKSKNTEVYSTIQIHKHKAAQCQCAEKCLQE